MIEIDAKIKYRVVKIKQGQEDAFWLVRETFTECGVTDFTKVALFNLDSEVPLFQDYWNKLQGE